MKNPNFEVSEKAKAAFLEINQRSTSNRIIDCLEYLIPQTKRIANGMVNAAYTADYDSVTGISNDELAAIADDIAMNLNTIEILVNDLFEQMRDHGKQTGESA